MLRLSYLDRKFASISYTQFINIFKESERCVSPPLAKSKAIREYTENLMKVFISVSFLYSMPLVSTKGISVFILEKILINSMAWAVYLKH